MEREKMKKKASYEEVLKIFDETHKAVDWESVKKWREEIKKAGWTDEEFDKELHNRITRKIA